MEDGEIKTKRLTDWKPETDIKLQKAFGKFVEEAGELLEVSYKYLIDDEKDKEQLFAEEIADCQATLRMITHASEERLVIGWPSIENYVEQMGGWLHNKVAAFSHLSRNIGKCLCIVGRCQIQGLDKSDPETKKPNIVALEEAMVFVEATLWSIVKDFDLDCDKINQRRDDKVESKLPWMMGTATDLLPDV